MIIALENIHKHFDRIHANAGIDMTLRPGTVHAVLGENGAGKSTLMKILAGFIRPSSGTIRVDGRPVAIASPRDAAALGIGMLYQDPLDFASLTVLENFIVGLARERGEGRRSQTDRIVRLCS